VLLLDEPLSNLDAKVRARLRSEIRRLQQDLRITTIYVTHDQEEALVLSDRIAVMDAGRVRQVGTPSDLYERPASLFVADFIGTSNFIAGTVTSVADGRAQVSTPEGPILGILRGTPHVGGRATAAIRPESLVLGEASGAENRVQGRVVLSQYMGSLLRYEVEAAGGTLLRIDIHDVKQHRPLPPGTTVTVGLPAPAVVVYPEDGFA
jgi:iron(III) transport system ATP-binding protein